MALVTPIPAGSRLTAELLAEWSTGINARFEGGLKTKSASTSRTSTTTYADDPHLAGIPLIASATYMVYANFAYNAGATPDFKYRFSVPTGCTFNGFRLFYNPAGGTVPPVINWIPCGPQGGVTGMNGAALDVFCIVTGTLIVGSTAGNLGLEWAQDTSSATASTVNIGSYLLAIRQI